MQKRNALLRLHKTLLARWRDLPEKLADELANLCDFNAADYTGDSADVAFETNSDEVSSKLAELDARERSQIERALACLKQGTYGICDNCERKITLTRLNALPYASCASTANGKWRSTPAGRIGRARATGTRSSTRMHARIASESISPDWKWTCPASGDVNPCILRGITPITAVRRRPDDDCWEARAIRRSPPAKVRLRKRTVGKGTPRVLECAQAVTPLSKSRVTWTP
jgi:DnaK suppressor protein